MTTWIEHLTQPLVLAGFGLFILWLALRPLFLTRCKRLPADAVERLLYRGMHLLFVLAVLLIAVGFILSIKDSQPISTSASILLVDPVVDPSADLDPQNASIPISLWLDSPDKTHFRQGDKPVLYYHVNPTALDPTRKQLWITLFNILDDGTVIMLIPRPMNATSTLNIATQTGRRYQMPRQHLKGKENAWLDSQLTLDQKGTERFKLIASSEQIVWDDEQWGEFRNHFPQQQGRDFLKHFKEKARQQRYWGEKDVQIIVE